jgi:hypothetical protein
MKLVYLLILVVAICIVITYIFIRLENTRKDVNVLQQKFENLNNLIDNKKTDPIASPKKKSPKKPTNSSSSLTSVDSEKYSEKKVVKEKNLFESFGLPDIFSLFNKSSILNDINLKAQPNFENFMKHPNVINIEEISTSDDESEATSVILVENEKKIHNDLENDKTEAYVDNDKQIEVYSNSEKTQKNEDDKTEDNNEPPKNVEIKNSEENQIVSEKIQETTQVQNNEIGTEITSEIIPETISEPINTETGNSTKSNNKKYTKNYLESLKLNDLKEIAKKHKVNVSTGKKLKNKTELINDLMKF